MSLYNYRSFWDITECSLREILPRPNINNNTFLKDNNTDTKSSKQQEAKILPNTIKVSERYSESLNNQDNNFNTQKQWNVFEIDKDKSISILGTYFSVNLKLGDVLLNNLCKEYILNDIETTLDNLLYNSDFSLYMNIYPNKNIDVIFCMNSKQYGYKLYNINVSDSDKDYLMTSVNIFVRSKGLTVQDINDMILDAI